MSSNSHLAGYDRINAPFSAHELLELEGAITGHQPGYEEFRARQRLENLKPLELKWAPARAGFISSVISFLKRAVSRERNIQVVAPLIATGPAPDPVRLP
jgi:hypothetical protein